MACSTAPTRSSSSSTRPACTRPRPRSVNGSTRRRWTAWPTTSTRCAWCSTRPSRSGAATSGWPPGSTSTQGHRRRQQGRSRRPRGGVRQLASRAGARCHRVLPGVGTDRRGGRRARRPPRRRCCRRGPPYFDTDVAREMPEEAWIAELVREQLLAVTRDELPYSIATRVTEIEWPRVRCEIIVERDSQKGMVIGKGGRVLKEVGTRARAQLPEGAFLELVVKVDKDWQHRPDRVERSRLLTSSITLRSVQHFRLWSSDRANVSDVTVGGGALGRAGSRRDHRALRRRHGVGLAELQRRTRTRSAG